MKKIHFLYNYLSRHNYFFKKKLEKILDYHEWASERIENEKNKKFVNTVKHAYQNSLFYRDLYNQHGVNINSIKSLQDITLLPSINKEQVRKRSKDILTRDSFTKLKGYTSGTSGTPLVVYRNPGAILEENAYLWAHRFLTGHQPKMKSISLRGDLDANTLEGYDPFTCTLYLSSYQLREENTEWYFKRIARFKPNAIFSYPSSIEALCNLLETRNYKLDIPYVFTSSETVYDFQREKVKKVLGAKIVDWYGNAERSIALEQLSDETYIEAPLYSFNEYFPDHIYTTSFLNSIFPLIRYEVEDVVQIDDSSISQNQKIISIQGRKDDFLVFSDGTKIGRMSGTLKGVNHIKYTQFVQNDPSFFVVNVVPSQGYNQQDEELLVKKISSKVGEVPFSVNKVSESEIIRTKAGKYKLIVNNFYNRKTEKTFQTEEKDS
ncbi:phenylacetate--CoA ligase family protein [Catalinimonas niigatensis]|uniref:hypothetical protein n=1 Tax=Catalinimonas niigatensis TaxID=1397264 RepID=UPI002665A2DC|nr:hypothetical protein [Catalinimonas niigatensis]WPP51362.1 hypothetical protein PZB72_03050 [Catalinimonas niigatensis]